MREATIALASRAGTVSSNPDAATIADKPSEWAAVRTTRR